MARYYYEDRIEAEWMAAKFGMRFQALHINYLDDGDFDTAEEVRDYRGGAKLSINPESLDLLKPVVGDIVQFGPDKFGVFGKENQDAVSEVIVLRRNGVMFIWPVSVGN